MMNSYFQPSNRIKVYGEGTISVSPDQADITLGAITEKLSLQEAQQENTMIITNVLSVLLDLGIPKTSIQTVTYRIDPLYDYKDGIQTFRGYKVNHQLQIKVENIELTGKVVDLAVRNGANSISAIEFTIAQPDAYYNEALKLALNNAFGRALSLTSQLAVTLSPIPFKIEEEKQSSPPVPYSHSLLAKAESTPIQPGEISLSAKVIVEYIYC